MRGFIIFALIAGLVFVYLRPTANEKTPVPAKSAAAQAANSKTVIVPANAPLAPAPRGQASEHNWMKRSLDRAADVTDQSRARAQESQR